GEEALAGLRRDEHDAEVLREVADEGEAVPGIDGERCEDWEDVVEEPAVDAGAVGIAEVGVGQDLDAGSAQGRMDLILIEAGLFLLQLADEPADGLELLARGHAVGRGLLDAGVDLAAEQADALHEELVEVAGE